ncbi:hypothetical protein BDV96DRAFT_606765 [Lophiotrema nucula]|uniref:Uncharacterized protein n=1 Tax=Lophiotrema nucula TaxID=690887 RepID=A0A6A5YJN1_9PLEO|nr:hypothetical protein BDV96DRAFT_606765 [Lophiotrema nucula]
MCPLGFHQSSTCPHVVAVVPVFARMNLSSILLGCSFNILSFREALRLTFHMVDWNLVAVVIALLAYPVQLLSVQPTVARSLGRLFIWLDREWSHLPEGSPHLQNVASHKCSESECADDTSFNKRLNSGSWSRVLGLLFPPAWSSAEREKVKKPIALSPWRTYIRTDADTLLVYVYTHLVQYERNYLGTWDEFSPDEAFEYFIKLEEHGGVLIGTRSNRWYYPDCRELHDWLKEMTKARMNVELAGWIAYSITQLRLENGADIPSPILTKKDLRRGGWVLALAMTSRFHIPRFLSSFVREALVEC